MHSWLLWLSRRWAVRRSIPKFMGRERVLDTHTLSSYSVNVPQVVFGTSCHGKLARARLTQCYGLQLVARDISDCASNQEYCGAVVESEERGRHVFLGVKVDVNRCSNANRVENGWATHNVSPPLFRNKLCTGANASRFCTRLIDLCDFAYLSASFAQSLV